MSHGIPLACIILFRSNVDGQSTKKALLFCVGEHGSDDPTCLWYSSNHTCVFPISIFGQNPGHVFLHDTDEYPNRQSEHFDPWKNPSSVLLAHLQLAHSIKSIACGCVSSGRLFSFVVSSEACLHATSSYENMS